MIGCSGPEMGKVRVTVIGVGNAGGMIVSRIAREGLPDVDCGAINTAIKDLGNCSEVRSLQIGNELTRGHGAGMDPQVGRKAALEGANQIRDFLGENDVLFLVAGFGKGTGTGATPVVGELAKATGCLTIALVTTPFSYEKRRHHEIAQEGLREIRDKVDAYVPLSNQRLFNIPSLTTVEAAFAHMDEVVLQAIRGIVDVLLRPGRMSLDLADLRALFKGAGQSTFAVATGKGESRVDDVLRGLAEFPFLDPCAFSAAMNLLVSLCGGPDLEMHEMEKLTTGMGRIAAGDPKMAMGIHLDESIQGEIRAMLLAGGVNTMEPSPDEYELFSGKVDMHGVPLYRPSQWPQRQANGIDREISSLRDDDTDVPAYLRKRKNGNNKNGGSRDGIIPGGR